MKNKLKGSRFMEFLTLFLMVVGTTVGAGIYLKNKELLGQTQNPIIAIILWAIVGIVCVMSIIVFIEISSSTKNFGNGTIGNWAKLFINRKTASFFSIIYMVAYVPTIYGLFAGSFIYYLFLLIGVNISAQVQLIVYLIGGAGIIITFSILNGLKPKWSKGIQVFGTVFKFIPLAIAFIAGFCLIKSSGNNVTVMWDKSATTYSSSNWQGTGFIRGFGAILLSFDGYIYLANAQKEAVHKEVVPKALLAGLIVVAVFYVLMAVSLFLGSKDGSIFSVFVILFSGKGTGYVDSGNLHAAGRIVGDVVLMLICIINMNVLSMVGTIQIESDSAAKTLYTGADRHVISKFKSALISGLFTVVVYCVFIVLGFFIKVGDGDVIGQYVRGWDHANFTKDFNPGNGITNGVTSYPLVFIGIMSSIGAIISFTMVTALIFAMIVNRFTNKVAVDKKKGALTLAFISGILFFAFIVFGIYTFCDPMNGHYDKVSWLHSSALPFIIIFVVMIAIVFIFWIIQEQLFKLYPFDGGFAGQLEDEDPRPYIFKFNPIVNYYTKKGTAQVQEYQERLKAKGELPDKEKRH